MVAWWVQPLEETNVVTIDIEHPSTAYPRLRVARETGAEAGRLVRGVIVEEAPPAQFFAAPAHERTRQFLSKIL